MPGAPHWSTDVGSEAGGFRVNDAAGNLHIVAWGYWPVEVVSTFGVDAPAAAQVLTPSSMVVFDSKHLKPQGAEGQQAIRQLFRALAQLPFAKGTIVRGNAMTCMQLSRLLRECSVDGRIEFSDTQPLGV